MHTIYKLSIVFSFLLFAGIFSVSGQVRGRVAELSADSVKQPLPGAAVWWAGTQIGVSADADGNFNIGRTKGHDKLVASYAGYTNDTIAVSAADHYIEFLMQPLMIEEVVVTASTRGNYNTLDGLLKNENISFAGLTKMACCNLAESFENSASVTVGYSDAITGARQIRMLGLAGIYTQILDETRPIMRGLASPYGLSYTPGMWLQSIQVSKGVSSVTGGHEAVSGQINLEHRKPTDDTPLFVNLYLDSELRREVNIATSYEVTDELSTVLLAHASANSLRLDHNGDGFMDSPLSKQINVANRWLYTSKNGMQIRAGAKYVNESRLGGQMDYDTYTDRRIFDSEKPYGSEAANENANAYLKIAIPLGKFVWNEETANAERSNIAFIADYNYYDTDAFYGQLKDYRGNQSSWLLNAMYSWNISTRHKLILGMSGTFDNVKEYLYNGGLTQQGSIIPTEGQLLKRNEREGGAYAEYSYIYRDKFSLVTGIRADYNNLHGWFATPRAHIRWSIAPNLIFRGSTGLGYRTANLLSDNLWALATGRTLVGYDDALNTLEKSLTYGGSLMWNFRLGNDNAASLSFDFYRTQFFNMVVADQEQNSDNIVFYNSTGRNYTNTYQADFNWTPFTGFDVLLTFRYNQTAITLQTADGAWQTVEKPLTDRFKGLINLQYATRFRRWVFDFTAQLNGHSRLPVQNGTLSDSEYSPIYPMFFFQTTYRVSKMISLYAGVENIGNYMQHHAIIAPDTPYAPQFNPSVIWGPLMGRKFYIGARINF